MDGYGISVQKRAFLVLVCLSVCVTFLIYNKDNIFELENMKSTYKKQKAALILNTVNRVWNNYIVTSETGYKGGRSLTTEDLENMKSRNHCRGQRFLVYKCDSSNSCGGWGDREKGIVSSFLLALLSNRTFIIDINHPCRLENFLLSNVYDWSVCYNDLKSIPKENVETLKYINNRLFKTEINNTNFDSTWTKQVIALRINIYAIDGIRQHKQAKERLKWLLNITNEEAIHLVLHTLFKPNKRMLTDAMKFNKNQIHDKYLVCSHIRIGKSPTIPADRIRLGADSSKTVILDFLKTYDDAKKYIIYIATDSEEVRRLAKTSITSYFNINRNIVHVDRLGKLKSDPLEACEGFYTAILEQYILSLCDTLLLTRSNFGAIAAYLRGVPDNLFLFHPKTQKILAANLTDIQREFKFV